MIVGGGSQRELAGRTAAESGAGERVVFAGAASADQLVGLYAGARAVAYPPFDEDYGYV